MDSRGEAAGRLRPPPVQGGSREDAGTGMELALAPVDARGRPVDALRLGLQLAATAAFGIRRPRSVSSALWPAMVRCSGWSGAAVGAGGIIAGHGYGAGSQVAGPVRMAAGGRTGLGRHSFSSMGAWPFAIMLLAAQATGLPAAYSRQVLPRTACSGGPVAFTCAVPVTVAAVMVTAPARAEAAVFALLMALVGQQTPDGLPAARRRADAGAGDDLGAFAGAGALVLIGLPFIEASPDHGLTAVACSSNFLPPLSSGRWWFHGRPRTRTGLQRCGRPCRWACRGCRDGRVSICLARRRKRGVDAGGGVSDHHCGSSAAAPAPLGILVVRRAAATVLALTAFHQLSRKQARWSSRTKWSDPRWSS